MDRLKIAFNEHTFHGLLQYYAKEGDIEGADEALRLMAEKKVAPTILIFNHYVSACLVASLKGPKHATNNNDNNTPTKDNTTTTPTNNNNVMRTWEAQCLEKAFSGLQRMKRDGLNTFSNEDTIWESLAALCIKTGEKINVKPWANQLLRLLASKKHKVSPELTEKLKAHA